MVLDSACGELGFAWLEQSGRVSSLWGALGAVEVSGCGLAAVLYCWSGHNSLSARMVDSHLKTVSCPVFMKSEWRLLAKGVDAPVWRCIIRPSRC